MELRDQLTRRILEATDIVQLIGEHLALQPKAGEFVALCPFHDDHKPSMTVVPAKQIYKCFSCGAGGDAYRFMMDYHRVAFPEARRILAKRAGIDLQDDHAAEQDPRQRLIDANARAMRFFRRAFDHPARGAAARAYTERRGMTARTIESFQIGYAPDTWDALTNAAGRDPAADRTLHEALLAVGLIARRREGEGCYDRFRHRLIFPILDAMSRPIAFGARRLRETDEPKYLNSPESPIFDKSATLFGLHAAKRPIIAARRAVIVEGYTDVTAAHQAGQTNVLATLGTALTAGHARQLRRYAEQIVLVFDGDEAGHKAAERALAVFLNEPVDVRIAVPPAGVDPADLLAGPDGAERWREMIDRAQDVLNFRFAQLREALHDRDSVAGRQQAAERMITQLHELGLTRQDPLRRGLILDRLAEVLGLDGSEVRRVVDRLAPRDRPPRRDAAPSDGDGSASGDGRGVARDAEPAVSGAVRRAERQILGLLLQDENWFHAPTDDGRSIDEAAPPEDFVTAEARALYSELYDRLAGGREASLASLLIAWAERGPDGEALTRLATDVVAETEAIAPDGELRAEMWRAAVATLQAHHREREAAEEAAALLRAARTPAERLAAAQRLASQRRRRATG